MGGYNDSEDALDPGTMSLANKESFDKGSYNDAEDAAPIDGKVEVTGGQGQASNFNDDAVLGIDDGNKVA